MPFSTPPPLLIPPTALTAKSPQCMFRPIHLGAWVQTHAHTPSYTHTIFTLQKWGDSLCQYM